MKDASGHLCVHQRPPSLHYIHEYLCVCACGPPLCMAPYEQLLQRGELNSRDINNTPCAEGRPHAHLLCVLSKAHGRASSLWGWGMSRHLFCTTTGALLVHDVVPPWGGRSRNANTCPFSVLLLGTQPPPTCFTISFAYNWLRIVFFKMLSWTHSTFCYNKYEE